MAAHKIRCAIYTRKSHEDGLEQEFNSLAAQREACLAYIASQKSEGWAAVTTHYDDGGFSGGTLQRPALQQLLADIEAGRIDVIVVYKVDRLTRSLTDFAKIVDRLDEHTASFVSVTQAFNTTTSMGRLTLNVLLSFAQFEREVTGERIRDKIAASKAKGMWMGGTVPLGYDVPAEDSPRVLVVNEQEAETVRHIYRRYLALGSVHLLCDELQANGIHSKVRITKRGDRLGGVPFARGALFHVLKNQTYLGRITHKEQVHEGLHQPILDQELFDAVQQQLAQNAQTRKLGKGGPGAALLKGLLFDEVGEPMSPTISYGKLKRAYRYYVSTSLQCGRRKGNRVSRISALKIEGVVADALHKLFPCKPSADWHQLKRPLIRVELKSASVDLLLRLSPEDEPLDLTKRAAGWAQLQPDGDAQTLRCSIPCRPAYRGGRTWIVTTEGQHPLRSARTDQKLIDALKASHRWQFELNASPFTPPSDLRLAKAHPDSYIRRLGQLAFLAPDIQRAILDGHQPPGLTVKRLLTCNIPDDWQEQRRVLGFS